jgi:putative tryptophan/tyrosine transport system ATP-binding protein
MKAIDLVSLSKTFQSGSESISVLKDFNLSIAANEFVSIIGSNGSGKSTLLNLLSGKIKPDQGKIFIQGKEVQTLPEHKRAVWIARVFQDPMQGTAPDLSVLENFRLAITRTSSKGLGIHTGKAFQEVVKEKIAQLGLGLETKINQEMGKLSGGQRQALTLLMASMTDADVLLMDEPTAALDPKTAALILELAQKFHKQRGWTTLMVTHNLKDAKEIGNRIILMKSGKIYKDLNGIDKDKVELTEIVNWFD